MPDAWAPVTTALRAAERAGREVVVWLRDDDAVTATPALDRLTGLCRRYALPALLAVIPYGADRRLAAHTAAEPLLTPTQHGFAHVNHAAAGERACEMGGDRPLAVVLDEVARGRDAMADVFGSARGDILVPPWNRIAPSVLPHLRGLGFDALSTFGDAHAGALGLAVVNSTLDIIDWRGGRRVHPEGKLADRLAAQIEAGQPIGVLTHHLVHDEAAWRLLDAAFARLGDSPAVRFVAVDEIRAGPSS